jgi:hypothetical protein
MFRIPQSLRYENDGSEKYLLRNERPAKAFRLVESQTLPTSLKDLRHNFKSNNISIMLESLEQLEPVQSYLGTNVISYHIMLGRCSEEHSKPPRAKL